MHAKTMESFWEIVGTESTAAFSYDDYWNGEQNIIKPALEKKGYANIHFSMGERDSFGPLTRLVYCTTPEGERTRFVYG